MSDFGTTTIYGDLTVTGKIKGEGVGGSGGNADTVDGIHATGTINTSINPPIIWGGDGATPVIQPFYPGNLYVGTAGKLQGYYNSGGSELPNFFGSANLRLQMLQGPSGWGWSDTLWMSSYAGGDVKGSNQLVISKSADAIGFRRQNFDATSWGPINEIYHSGRKPTLAELGAMPSGQSGLGVSCVGINDFNTALKNGFYMGAGVANAPHGNWFFGYTINHHDGWVCQKYQDFSSNRMWYQRNRNDNVWESWKRTDPIISSSGPSGGVHGEVWIQYS